MTDFNLKCQIRDLQGKGASRRLRHQNLVPAVIYGGDAPAQSVAIAFNHLTKALESEAFYSHVLTLDVAGKTEQGVWGGRDPQAMLCCHWCGRNFPRPPKGAPPKMCSKECRTDAHMDAKRRYARKVQQELPPLIEFCDVCGFEPAGPGGMASHRYAAHGLKGPLRRSA